LDDLDLKRTPLFDLHRELGAKMVPFAGYCMPVQYPLGVMGEHLHTRAKAGLFDVSHMGQVVITGADPAGALERLVPVDIVGLAVGRQRYAMFTNDAGGILDDLMVVNRGADLFLVVNAACKAQDVAHLTAGLPDCVVTELTDRALLALQGPYAEASLVAMGFDVTPMRFMDYTSFVLQGIEIYVTRSGYTGEDGFEISVPATHADRFARAALALPDVAPIGLGARDSLRLEAGLCLYGHDIDETTTPVAANLTWAIQKARRAGGARAGGFPGADRILQELTDGPDACRVGLRPDGRAPIREGTPLFDAPDGGHQIGHVTSGGFGPSLGAPIAMGYVPKTCAVPDTKLWAELRGKRLPVTVCELPFRPSTYKR
jgi:aminomethyltransferase